MIEDIIGVSVIAVVASVLSVMMKRDRPEFSIMLATAAGTIIVFSIIPAISGVAELVMTVSEVAGIGGEYIVLIIKSCTIAMVTGVCASTCRDAGNSSLALKLEIAGRVSVLVLAIPVINTLFNIILSVIK